MSSVEDGYAAPYDYAEQVRRRCCAPIRVNSLELVAEFHRVFEQCTLETPDLSNVAVNAFRVRLLQEELEELREALQAGDAVAALDALTDLQYVLDGTYLSLGLHRWKSAALLEVQRANMSKLENGRPLKRDDGKILKGSNYSAPDIAAVLASAP